MKLRLGTRGSDLARAQSGRMARALQALGHEVEMVWIKTSGDANQRDAFQAVGAPGVFVRELESALCDERIDLAVHSYKDLPSVSADGLCIAAVPEREDCADVLFARPAASADSLDLPLVEGARLGTASARREALVRALRPDLEVALLRGNVPTRLRKLVDGEYDAILLAGAGVQRLERAAAGGECEALPTDGLERTRLEPELFVPAPSQGALALQVRSSDTAARDSVSALDDIDVRGAVTVERELLAEVQGGCELPFGAWCRASESGGYVLDAILGAGQALLRARSEGATTEGLAQAAWRELCEQRGGVAR